MRKIVLSIAFVLLAVPVAAAELECNVTTAAPPPEFVKLVTNQYRDLTEAQAISIAKGILSAYQVEEALQSATKDEERQLAQRSKETINRIIAVQLYTFRALPRMEAVLKRMEAEKLAGLKRVSAELEPEVRATGREMVFLIRIWGEISGEANAIAVERVLTAAQDGNATDKFIDQAERSLCLVGASLDLMGAITDLLPSAILLAYVEHLNY